VSRVRPVARWVGDGGELERVASAGAGDADDDGAPLSRGGPAHAPCDPVATAQLDRDLGGDCADVARAQSSAMGRAMAIGGERGDQQLAVGSGRSRGSRWAGGPGRQLAAGAVEDDVDQRGGGASLAMCSFASRGLLLGAKRIAIVHVAPGPMTSPEQLSAVTGEVVSRRRS
jgi:hypothetical protein